MATTQSVKSKTTKTSTQSLHITANTISNLWRKTSAEKRELERLESTMYEDIRRAAEVHRQVKSQRKSQTLFHLKIMILRNSSKSQTKY